MTRCPESYTRCFRVIYFPFNYTFLHCSIVWIKNNLPYLQKRIKSCLSLKKKILPLKPVRDFSSYSQQPHLSRTSLSFPRSFSGAGVTGNKASLCREKQLVSVPLPPFPLGGAKSLLCPLYLSVIQRRIYKNRQSHHCCVRADNLDCAHFKTVYLKRSLLCMSEFLHAHACGMWTGIEGGVFHCQRAPSSALKSDSPQVIARLSRLHIIL